MRKGHLLLAVIIIGTASPVPAYTQPASTATVATTAEPSELRVAAFIVPPLVMEQNGTLTGFNIDLWNAIAARLKRKTIYQIAPDVSALEEAMLSKTADLTLALIITSARDEVFDFSYPTLEAGLQIMVRDAHQTAATENQLWAMLRLMLSRTTVAWLGMALLLVLIPSHVIWLLERRRGDSAISRRDYYPGIFEAAYWALSTLTTQAEAMPRHWLARILSVLWMFAGVVFVAFYTAQLTTTLTVEQIRGAIEGPDDLPGKQVATVAHSLAVDYLREHRAQVQEYSTIDQLFKALADKKVDAVVTGAPILRYYAAHDGKGQVKMVGSEINVAPVAIMLQLDSPLRKKIDIALLALREDGSYQRLYDKWFGSP